MTYEEQDLILENKFLRTLINLRNQDVLQVSRVCSSYSKEDGEVLLGELNTLLKKVEEHKKKFENSIKDQA